MRVEPVGSAVARALVEKEHYLHRKPPVSYAYGLFVEDEMVGVVTFGVPASHHLRLSACPSSPGEVLELNRLWVSDAMPRNTESWFLARALKALPPRIVVSYADTVQGHAGYVYRAANFLYAGLTDQDRKTPRYDYVPLNGKHSRDAFRTGEFTRVRRRPKHRYWLVTGDRREKRRLMAAAGWPQMSWSGSDLV